MDEAAVAAEAAQVKGSVMKPWMIAVLASVAVILVIAGVIWLRSRKRTDEEPQALEGAPAAGALAADSGDEAGAESGEPASSEPTSAAAEPAAAEAAPTSADPGAHADAGAAPAPDLLTDAEQISEEEIAAGRTAALTTMLEQRGKQ